ncbi:RNA-directed DNA polymerase [Erysipelothrix rhusiopathiae]|nr:RNA-directed DNA polymerase [Erysipelothrix rhusiopathiae]
MRIESNNIQELTPEEAQSIFLEPSSYTTLTYPNYINFERVICEAKQLLSQRNLSDLYDPKELRNAEEVNYTIYINKNSTLSWRPISLIHPLLYVDLVSLITQEDSWAKIQNRLERFKRDTNIICSSNLLVSSKTDSKVVMAKSMIIQWYENFEQEQIKLSMEYNNVIHTDISSCYSSMYTHSIAWAVEGKSNAKKDRNNRLLGNRIDKKVRDLQQSQTNGIPQGSVLMDFIAELVLGYSDYKLSEEIKKKLPELEYKILRFRDDYRIFTSQKEDGFKLLRCLSDVLRELGLSLNDNKTFSSNSIIIDAIKHDKLYWNKISSEIFSKDTQMSAKNRILEILILSKKYPNCGSLKKALNQFNKYIKNEAYIYDLDSIMAILTDIVVHNPKSTEQIILIFSEIFRKIENKTTIKNNIQLVLDKHNDLPHVTIIEIWLQRLNLCIDNSISFNSLICKKVAAPNNYSLWNSDWLNSNIFKEIDLINEEARDNLDLKINENLDIFSDYN